MFIKTLATALALTAIALLLAACHLTATRYDLSLPVTEQDWLMVWEDPDEVTSGILQTPDLRVRAGQALFGYEAPLVNYIRITPLGLSTAGSDTVESWIDDEAPARYFLPLYDGEGDWARTLLVWREQNTVLIAHSFDDDYLKYLTTKEQLDNYLVAAGESILQQNIFWTWRGMFVLAETGNGAFGQFFNDFASAQDQELPDALIQLPLSQVLSEAELVQILENMRDIIEDSTPTNPLDDPFEEED